MYHFSLKLMFSFLNLNNIKLNLKSDIQPHQHEETVMHTSYKRKNYRKDK